MSSTRKASRNIARRSLGALASLAILSIGLAGAGEESVLPSAWDVMVEQNPRLAEDSTLAPVERKILQVLTMEQAVAYTAGADPATIVLADGTTLDAMIAVTEKNASDAT